MLQNMESCPMYMCVVYNTLMQPVNILYLFDFFWCVCDICNDEGRGFEQDRSDCALSFGMQCVESGNQNPAR